jgi:hypothetical protein
VEPASLRLLLMRRVSREKDNLACGQGVTERRSDVVKRFGESMAFMVSLDDGGLISRR